MPRPLLRILTVTCLATLVTAAVLLLQQPVRFTIGRQQVRFDAFRDLLEDVELYHTDLRYLYRARLDPLAVPVCPDICIVGIDDASYDRIQEHYFEWLPYYGQVVDAVLDAGATVVGLDILVEYAPREQEREMLFAARDHPNQLVLACFIQEGGGTTTPFEALQAVAYESQALVNATRDQDGVLRSQSIYPQESPKAGLMGAFPYFAALLAERHTGRPLDKDTRRLGDLPIPSAAVDDPRLRVNFAGTPVDTPFPEYSFHEVLALVQAGDTQALRRRFQGKAVLFGSTAFRDQDVIDTPFGRTLQDFSTGSRRQSMFGIRVHAQVLNTLLTGAFIRTPTPAQAALMIWLATLITAFLVYALPAVWGMGAGLLAGAAYWLAAAQLFLHHSLLVPVAPVLLAVPLAMGAVYSYRYWFQDAEGRRIRSAFSRYVSPDVMEEMLKFPRDYRPDRAIQREMTVMFSDINGFSTVCEGRSAEEVTQMLNEHFVEMTQILFRNRGTLIRFNGDEFMVLFGAPKPQEEPEKDAVRCAVEMVERLAEMEKADPTGKNGFYRVKIGINAGKMILTSIGTSQRSDYNAIGDSANLASRVMSLAKQEGVPILISDTVYEKARWMPDFDFVCQGEFPVKGREGLVRVYRPVRSVSSP